jgi:hypothetical protein
MSRTNRKNRRDRDERVMSMPPGLKRLGERDQDDRRARVLAYLRENRGNIITVGSATGFGFSFRFAEVWASMFPNVPCPARRK